MTLNPDEKIVKGNSTNGIAYNGYQYFPIVNGDKIAMFGDDMESAEKVFKEKTGRDV